MTSLSAPTATGPRTLGAVIDDHSTRFRVWAPERDAVDRIVFQVPLEGGGCPGAEDIVRLHPLQREPEGYWTARVAGPYKFRLNRCDDQLLPDQASRYQPFGVHGPSAVVDRQRPPRRSGCGSGIGEVEAIRRRIASRRLEVQKMPVIGKKRRKPVANDACWVYKGAPSKTS